MWLVLVLLPMTFTPRWRKDEYIVVCDLIALSICILRSRVSSHYCRTMGDRGPLDIKLYDCRYKAECCCFFSSVGQLVHPQSARPKFSWWLTV